MGKETLSTLDAIIIVIGVIGSIASVTALLMTIKINRKVERLQDEFLQTARLPVLLDKLIEHRDRIEGLLNESKAASKDKPLADSPVDPFSDRFLSSFQECNADLIDLRSKLDEKHGKPIEGLISNIEKLDRRHLGHKEIGNTLATLTGVIRQIGNNLEDRKLVKRANS